MHSKGSLCREGGLWSEVYLTMPNKVFLASTPCSEVNLSLSILHALFRGQSFFEHLARFVHRSIFLRASCMLCSQVNHSSSILHALFRGQSFFEHLACFDQRSIILRASCMLCSEVNLSSSIFVCRFRCTLYDTDSAKLGFRIKDSNPSFTL